MVLWDIYLSSWTSFRSSNSGTFTAQIRWSKELRRRKWNWLPRDLKEEVTFKSAGDVLIVFIFLVGLNFPLQWKFNFRLMVIYNDPICHVTFTKVYNVNEFCFVSYLNFNFR